MRTTVVRFVVAGAALALASCDLFVPPRVACDTIVLPGDLQAKAEKKGASCLWEALSWRVSHAPRVDAAWAKENGNPSQQTLVNTPVRVTASAGAAVCEGSDCAASLPATTQIDVKIDKLGALTYEVLLGGEAAHLLIPNGAETTLTGTAVTEVYGPGNECFVTYSVKAKCADPDDTTTGQ